MRRRARTQSASPAPRRDRMHGAPDPLLAAGALLETGHEALRRGDWAAATARFEARVAHGDDSPEAWEGLGFACHWLQDTPRMFEARQRAYQSYLAQGEVRSAARVAIELGSDCLEFRGERAVSAGWLERAEQLLEGLEPSVEHAYLRAVDAHVALAARNDPAAARAAAAEALRIARLLRDVDREVLARAVDGLARVIAGDVADGMRRLDAAAVVALGGEMTDLKAISVTCCYMIQACERVRDLERAAEWCTRFREFSERWQLGMFLTFCRIQYGTVLLWRGEWDAAESELIAARDELATVRPTARAAVLVRLGELRRRQGRFEEAAALLEEARTHRLATLRRAALALDRNDPVTAEELADQALRRSTGPNDTERVAALELLARARLARGALEEAAAAVAELEHLAGRIGTDLARAATLFAAGLLARARGCDDDARRMLSDAADDYERGSAPFEAACARVELARALFAVGRHDAARTEARTALENFDRLGASRHADEAHALLDEAPATSSGRTPARATSRLTRRQLQILRLVAQGLGNRDIAARLFLSEFTVRRHLANIYMRLGVSSRAAAVARALRDELL